MENRINTWNTWLRARGDGAVEAPAVVRHCDLGTAGSAFPLTWQNNNAIVNSPLYFVVECL